MCGGALSGRQKKTCSTSCASQRVGIILTECAVVGCAGFTGGPGTAKGYCERHYRKFRLYGDPHVSAMPPRTTCSQEGCDSLCIGRGLCELHYHRLKRHGDPQEPGPRRLDRPNGLRRCMTCRRELERAEFYRSKSRWLSSDCKNCARTKAREWHQRNREKSREMSRRQRRENPGRSAAHASRRRAQRMGLPTETFLSVEIFDRDGWVCGICGDHIDRDAVARSPESASVDHVIPLARGGHHVRANVQAAHLGCNMSKGASLPVG